MNASELIYILQAAKPNASIQITQPRHWVKKQPDKTNTRVLRVSVWHDGSSVHIETM